jgi:hypothetical protein
MTPLQQLRRLIDEHVPGTPAREELEPVYAALATPIPMLLFCPACGQQHIDAPDPDDDWDNPPHTSHKCVGPNGCGTIWRPADVPTAGVERIQTRGSSDNWSAGEGVGLARAFRLIARELTATTARVRDQMRAAAGQPDAPAT